MKFDRRWKRGEQSYRAQISIYYFMFWLKYKLATRHLDVLCDFWHRVGDHIVWLGFCFCPRLDYHRTAALHI